ncbi:hypothetical protein [Pseudomonas sp. Q12-87]|uniref:hypothetical protein n=1 Tax=Pseudomonas sp. Q12-87 TaxID=177989 RepID=UPI000A6B0D9D|nr:hypothetical protein [Pseudomonas sp. Q12-87]
MTDKCTPKNILLTLLHFNTLENKIINDKNSWAIDLKWFVYEVHLDKYLPQAKDSNPKTITSRHHESSSARLRQSVNRFRQWLMTHLAETVDA